MNHVIFFLVGIWLLIEAINNEVLFNRTGACWMAFLGGMTVITACVAFVQAHPRKRK